MTPLNHSDRNASTETGIRVMVLSPVLLLALMILCVASWLRETPLFWENAGGYPIWLRETVYALFYPWYGLTLMLLVIWQYYLTQGALRARWMLIPCIMSTLFVWGIFFGSNCIILANNIDNLLNGRALHSH